MKTEQQSRVRFYQILRGVLAMMLAVVLCSGLFMPEAEAAKKPKKEKKHPLAGLTISIMGDSISTYTGWSDHRPITDPSCTNRYGEAYYGPEGGDFHCTELLVQDTWWHQAASELGLKVNMVNSGNSTGLLYASYPGNLDWQLYLQEMLAWKSRPNYLAYKKNDPDIIALYIGSNDVARGTPATFSSVDEVDFDALIAPDGHGGYLYAEPTTVAEAYCILLHKVKQNYPKAEIYCFAVVPNAGGTVYTINKRLQNVHPFNEMVRGVAAHYGAHVVELMDAFQLDPDGDGIATQEAVDTFKTYYHEDPHPNAAGFDVITDCFVETVLENTRLKHRAGPVHKLPKTGDGTEVALLAVIGFASLAALLVLRRRRA